MYAAHIFKKIGFSRRGSSFMVLSIDVVYSAP
jgi:hypothetical protein